MTKDEKLKKALNALKEISGMRPPGAGIGDAYELAATVHKEITAPKMETVEIVTWAIVRGDKYICGMFETEKEANVAANAFLTPRYVVKQVGTYQRPVEEKEPEVWEREVKSMHSIKVAIVYLPDELVGKTVEVRLKEEE